MEKILGIASHEFSFLRFAYLDGLLPRRASILEFGEAEVVGHIKHFIYGDSLLISDEEKSRIILDAQDYEASLLAEEKTKKLGLFMKKQIYKVLFDYSEILAVEYGGSSEAIKADLNEPISIGKKFDVSINCGTSEHVFNQYQFFKSMHEHTSPGGVMIHWTPTFGFVNHGFYNCHPGLFADLAYANKYTIELMCVTGFSRIVKIDDPHNPNIESLNQDNDLRNALICVIMKKTEDCEFKAPWQRIYR